MIAKAHLLERARAQGLLPTTVEKDYVLGWMLAAISQHPRLSEWVFKGDTCLKKCFFETYRFSEDLDFTIPTELPLSSEGIASGLGEIAEWVEDRAGISFPLEKMKVEKYTNPRGKPSFQAKLAYICRLNRSPNSLPRIKFDLTQDELLADKPDHRAVSHPYADAPSPTPRVCCYSVDEILAEKTRALYERQGRARDVYDLVHLSREFRGLITPVKASELLRDKFDFKELPTPTVDLIVGRVDEEALRANWQNQLAHQLPKLPPLDGFLSDLRDAIAWWLDPEQAQRPLPAIAGRAGERSVPRQHLPEPSITHQGPGYASSIPGGSPIGGMGMFDRIRYAARNRLCAEIQYHGASRIVEPYSLRLAETGNTLLYAHELLKNGRPTGQIKAFAVNEIQATEITDTPFKPRHMVEL